MLPRIVSLCLAVIFALATCQFVPPPAAVLTVDGSDVRLNGAPASTGDLVGPGDHVSTGAASAARIGWSLRRYMLVDENSIHSTVGPARTGRPCRSISAWAGS